MNQFYTPTTFQVKTIVLLGMFFLFGCSAQKALLEEAGKLESAGMLQSAFTKYQAVHDQYNNTDAAIGMNRVCQQMLQQKCNEALSLCMSDQHELGLEKMREAKSFYETNRYLEIKMPANIEFQIQECKNGYVNKLLEQAEAAAMNMELAKAEELIDKVHTLDYDNAPAQALSLLIRIIPIYTEGQKAYDLGLWRQAYTDFNRVCELDIAYRDAKVKRDESLRNAHVSLAYVAKEGTAPAKVMSSLASKIKGEILGHKNPFIELLERADLEVLIREQQNTLGAEFDGDNGPEAGKFRRASYLLVGEIISYKANLEPERILNCDCGKTMNIYSDKVQCFEYSQRRTLELTFRYQLVDAETGKIFMADVMQQKIEDQGVRYDFEIGKKFSLTSPTLNKNHEVDLTNMKKPKEDYLVSESELSDQAINAIAKEIARRVVEFNP